MNIKVTSVFSPFSSLIKMNISYYIHIEKKIIMANT